MPPSLEVWHWTFLTRRERAALRLLESVAARNPAATETSPAESAAIACLRQAVEQGRLWPCEAKGS